MKREEIIELSKEHNHISKEDKIKKDEIRKDIKKEVAQSKDPFSIKLPKLYESMSADKGICGPL